MARRVLAPSLATPTARAQLKRRKKPYRAAIAPGVWLSYRANKGAGTWSVDADFGLKRFALADDIEQANGETVLNYKQALKQASDLARAGEGHSDALITVGEAIDKYQKELKGRGAAETNATGVRFNMPEKLAAKPVALLEAKDLKDWRNDLVVGGLKLSSANRLGHSLKAALNLVSGDANKSAAWRGGLTLLADDTENARNIILPDDVVQAVVRTAYEIDHHMGVWIHALAETGVREIQVTRLEVHDLQDDRATPRLMMPSSKKGKNRKITRKPLPISPHLAKALRQASQGRLLHMPLLEPVKQLSERFYAVTKRLGLGDEVTPYALRHSSIVSKLLKGIPTRLVAAAHDTSVAEIERTYSRDIVSDHTEATLRGTLLDFTPPPVADNVVSITARA
jgi:hypothetical protein